MAGIVVLEDGSDIYTSNMGLGGALAAIGEAIPDIDARLSRWLLDVSERCAPFMDFDLRGLSADSRRSFWIGVDRAYAKGADWDLDASFSPSVAVVRLFHERRDVQGFPFSENVDPIDLDEIWSDDEGT
jgi:hypothetical protein